MGSDFGQTSVVTIGESECDQSFYNSSLIICDYSAGEGANLDLTVVVGNQQITRQVSFSAPELYSYALLSGKASTIGGDLIQISGANFGSSLSVTVSGKECQILSFNETLVQCYIPKGSGSGNALVASMASQTLSNALLFDYDKPTLSGIFPESGNTVPGSLLTIYGDNFIDSVSSISVLYAEEPITPDSVSISSQPHEAIFRIGDEAALVSQQSHGAASIAVSISVDGQQSDDSVSYGFEAPAITSISNSATSPSNGDFNITIHGENFGLSEVFSSEAQTHIPSVKFNTSDGVASIPAANIVFSRSNSTVIVVQALPRTSSRTFDVFVEYRGQTSNAVSFTYDSVSISGVQSSGCTSSANAISECPLLGGVAVTVAGDSFSPNPAEIYVNISGSECTVDTSASVALGYGNVVCTLPQASNPYWDATVRVCSFGDCAEDNLVSYSGPTVIDLQGTLTFGSTAGGETITVVGLQLSETIGDLGVTYGPLETPDLYSCTVGLSTYSNPNYSIECTSSAGVGQYLYVQVSVNGIKSPPFTDVSMKYPAPFITAGTMVNVASQENGNEVTGLITSGELLSFEGGNFGSQLDEIYVTYGAASSPETFQCFVVGQDEIYTHYGTNDTRITCRTSPGEGSSNVFRVHLAYGRSSTQYVDGTDEYHYPAAPKIESVHGCEDQDDNVTTANCPTDSLSPETSKSLRITITGQNFDEGAIVNVGGQLCLDARFISAESKIECNLPSGTGLEVAIVVNLNGLISLSKPYLSYAIPTLDSISGCSGELTSSTKDCSRGGGTTITVTGSNFGESEAKVIIGGNECQNLSHSLTDPHRKVTCEIVEGVGVDHSVILLQNQGELSASSLLLSYEQCVFGQYALSGTTQCIDCSPGTFSTSLNQGFCLECPAGKYVGLSKQKACLPCSPGRSSGEPGASACTLCGQGYKSDIEGALSCDACPVGTFSDTLNATTCTQCSPGTFQADSASSSCSTCPKGTFTSTEGRRQCDQCDSGTFSNETAMIECHTCSKGKFSVRDTSALIGPTSCTACVKGMFNPETGQGECAECSAGTFSDATGQTVCEQCVEGTFNTLTGLSFCTDCEKGSFSSRLGSVFCDLCGPGQFAPETGNSTCTLCPAGKIQSESGATFCISCSVGAFTNAPGQAACSLCDEGEYGPVTGLKECLRCAPGKFSSSGASTCTDCPKGSFASSESQARCEGCAAGSYSKTQGSSVCALCEVGRYLSAFDAGSGASSCMKCPAGSFAEREGLLSVEACSAGTFSSAEGMSFCRQCPAGRFQDKAQQTFCMDCSKGNFGAGPGQSSCEECVNGEYSNKVGSLSCSSCTKGRFSTRSQSDGGVSFCAACEAGKFSRTAKSNKCDACSSGSYSAAPEMSHCLLCPAGRISHDEDGEGASHCIDCVRGTFGAEDGEAQCELCGIGTYSAMNASTTCRECEVGRYQPSAGSTTCLMCAAGTYSSSTGKGVCDPCDSGTFENKSASAECIKCPAGTISKADIGGVGPTECTLCPVGEFSDAEGLDTCKACPKGTFGNVTGIAQCAQCPPGRYNPEEHRSTCIDCAVGKISGVFGGTSCTDCVAGFFSSTAGVSACQICQGGTFQDLVGESYCKLCEIGSASSDSGRTKANCDTCPQGRFAGEKGWGECQLCPAGKTSPVRSSTCISCAAGKFSSIPGQNDCSSCSPGFYSLEEATKCLPCAAGKFQASVGSSFCLNCTAGRYIPTDGQETCLPCPLGSFNTQNVSTACELCPAGKFSNAEQITACSVCNPGNFCPRGSVAEVECEKGAVAAISGQFRCTQCFENSQPTISKTECICKPGFYLRTDINMPRCDPCPEGASCTQEARTAYNLESKKGWWRESPLSMSYYRCLLETHCPGGKSQTCKENHIGPLCGVCKTGYRQDASQNCTPCGTKTSSAVTFTILTVLICTALFLQLYIVVRSGKALFVSSKEREDRLRRIALEDFFFKDGEETLPATGNKKPEVGLSPLFLEDEESNSDVEDDFSDVGEPGRETLSKEEQILKFGAPEPPPNFTYKFKILLGFAQISTNLSVGLSMQWPSTLKQVISWLDFANIDYIRSTQVECVTNLLFYHKMLLITLLPMGVMGVIGLTYVAMFAVQKCMRVSRTQEKMLRRQFWKVSLFIAFLIYPGVSSTVFRIFVCKRIDSRSYLLADLRHECYTHEWFNWVAYAGVMIMIYPVGIPLVVYIMLRKFKRKLHWDSVLATYGFLYAGFTKEARYFEIIDMIHKLFLTSILALFPSDYQIPLGLVVAYIYLAIIFFSTPYMRRADDRLHLYAQTEIILLLMGGNIINILGQPEGATNFLVTAMFFSLVIFFMSLFAYETSYVLKSKMDDVFRSLSDVRTGIKEYGLRGMVRNRKEAKSTDALSHRGPHVVGVARLDEYAR